VKLLFDQNLSFRLCRLLGDIVTESAQVRALGLDRASDDAVWEFARREGFTIVTLDADYADLVALRGAPPKVIWLRCGNQPTQAVERLIRGHADLLAAFIASEDASCLELY